MLAEKVVKLENTEIYDQILKFLEKHSYNSDKTRDAYEKDIKLFFKLMRNKEIKHLNREDVQLTLDDFEDFTSKLYNASDDKGEKAYANKTINRKISAVKGLTKYLAGKKYIKDVAFIELIDTLPENSNSHGFLETHEVFRMAELALNETHKGVNKSLAILFSLDTCARKSEVLNMKWSNFVEKEDVVLVKGIGKGNKEFRQSISKEFYNELLDLKVDGSDSVFNLSNKNIDDMMRRLRNLMKFPKERNIVFHSIRKGGATFRYRLTNDIVEAKRSLNHSNLATTTLYLAQQDYGDAIGAVSSRGNLNMDLYKEVDNETLLQAIEMCNSDFKVMLNMKLKEICG
jgi:integrase